MENSNPHDDSQESLIKQLVDASCFKTGEFTLKSGCISHYYIDLRLITMHQELLRTLVTLMKDLIVKLKQENNSTRTAIVGVPYGVVPVASIVAYESNSAYYPIRKETKDYGNKQVSENFDHFDHILIEDVMSTGGSIVDTIKKLDGKKVTDVIVIVDRESGGNEKLRAEFPNIKLHSLLKVSDILQVLGKDK